MDFMRPRKNGIQASKPIVRIERVRDEKKPSPLPSKLAASKRVLERKSRDSTTDRYTSPSSLSPASPVDRNGNGYSHRLQPPKRKASRQRSPIQMRLESDSDDDESPFEREETPRKRLKSDRPIDTKRRLRSKEGFSEDGGNFKMIHAADIVSVVKKSKLAAHILSTDNVTVELKYPSASQRERYDLVFGRDKIDPAQEIHDIAKIVTNVYLTPEQRKPFSCPDTGILRKIEKAMNLLSRATLDKELLSGFKIAVDVYNSAIERLVKDGHLADNLDIIHELPLDMIRMILRQVYDRAVSPKVDLLKQYENGTDNVYGELLPPFVSKVLAETRLRSDQIFVDLGSGVGNVVLQAALEIGCESWGCEMMENACTLADAQNKEFEARCRLWGIRPGKVHLERGDFLENQQIQKAMRKADVILVNNQAFTPKLNQNLTDLFLDLKNGCKIISLKSFVPHGHTISKRNLSNPVNLLDVVPGEYGSDNVSWTDAGGSYFIATKDDERVKAFAKRV